MSDSTQKPMKKTRSRVKLLRRTVEERTQQVKFCPFKGGGVKTPTGTPPTLRNPNRRKPLRIISSGSENRTGAQSAVAAATKVIPTAHA